MIDVIEATFQDGVFKPDRQPANSDATRVRLVVEPVNDESESVRRQASASIQQLWQSLAFDSLGDRLSRDERHERG